MRTLNKLSSCFIITFQEATLTAESPPSPAVIALLPPTTTTLNPNTILAPSFIYTSVHTKTKSTLGFISVCVF